MAETQEGLFYYRLKIPTFWLQAGTAAALAWGACLVTALAPAPAQLLQELRVQCEVPLRLLLFCGQWLKSSVWAQPTGLQAAADPEEGTKRINLTCLPGFGKKQVNYWGKFAVWVVFELKIICSYPFKSSGAQVSNHEMKTWDFTKFRCGGTPFQLGQRWQNGPFRQLTEDSDFLPKSWDFIENQRPLTLLSKQNTGVCLQKRWERGESASGIRRATTQLWKTSVQTPAVSMALVYTQPTAGSSQRVFEMLHVLGLANSQGFTTGFWLHRAGISMDLPNPRGCTTGRCRGCLQTSACTTGFPARGKQRWRRTFPDWLLSLP